MADLIPFGVKFPIKDAFKKMNKGIQDAEDSLNTANEAKSSADQTRAELDQAILEGDSSPLAGQLSVGADSVTYPSAQERFLQEFNNQSTQITDAQNELAKKKSYEGSLVKLLKDYSALSTDIAVHVRAETRIDVAVFYQKNKATVYTMQKDGDGWWRLFNVKLSNMKKIEVAESVLKGSNFDSRTGVWTESQPYYYTEEVGATFEGEFEGTGFNFNHRTDDRGGIWEFVIDGYITKQVSTYSASQVNDVESLVVKGLPNGIHSYTAEFIGADPNTVGTPRGWVNYYPGTGTTPRTITPYVHSFEETELLSVLQNTSRKEFAFSVRPDGASTNAQWVPEHGNLGAMKSLASTILIDGDEITVADELSNNYRITKDIQFVTNYEAHYTEDNTKLWDGRIDQTINPEGFHIRGLMDFVTNTEIVVGYPVMMAVNKTDTLMDRVVTSEGVRYVIDPDLNDGSRIQFANEPVSVGHFKDSSSNQLLENYLIAFEVTDFKRTMRIGQEGRPSKPTEIQLRTDGERKTYYSAFEDHVVQSGERYDFGCTYFIGELFEASNVLP